MNRYVELSYEKDGKTTFFATIVDAHSPKEAWAEAQRALVSKHGSTATSVEQFLQRKVTDRRLHEIEAAMTNGTWQGWFSRPEEIEKEHS